MKEDDRGSKGLAELFVHRRRAWVGEVAAELSSACEWFSPRLYAAAPRDLGDQGLVRALLVARVAAADAQVRPTADVVAGLERVLGPGVGGRGLPVEAVTEVLSGLRSNDLSRLWSWEAATWESLLMSEWLRRRTVEVGSARAESELSLRWGASRPVVVEGDVAERVARRRGLRTLSAYFAAAGDEPARLLVDAVSTRSHVATRVRDRMALATDGLDGTGHLLLVEEEHVRAAELQRWCDLQSRTAAPATKGFLEHIATAVGTYRQHVLAPVVEALSAPEQAMLRAVRVDGLPEEDAYLAEFLQESGTEPGRTEEVFEAAADGGEPMSLPALQAPERFGRGEHSWHGADGSLPVWCHIVTTPQERAAAIAFSGAAVPPVVHLAPAAPDWGRDSLFGHAASSEDWYPEPGIRLYYDRGSVRDMCELLVLTRLGHARLDFLVPDAAGSFKLLRSVRAELAAADREWWAEQALQALRALVPFPEALPEVLAEENGAEEADQGGAGGEPPSGGGEPEDAPATGGSAAHDSLPPALLAKVRALLRQAEDPAATDEEARTFLKKATDLMAKYGIEQAMLHAERPETDRIAERLVEVANPWAKQSRFLLGHIASALRCRSVILDRRDAGGAVRRSTHLFGFASDLARVDVLYASLRLQMLSGVERAGREHRPDGEDIRAYKRSWMYGFIREVCERIVQAEKAAQRTVERERQEEAVNGGNGPGVALVLADRDHAVEAKRAAAYPNLRKAGKVTFRGSGFRQGRLDGQRADIGGPSVEEDRQAEQLTS
ncbi:DUF2786 domain-containing protein [Kitasatospora sp. NPDC007106]|uniref:DUF2786 domain-containing protein n=1 Tax=Kitasatospora sp. NPDC007106 TaxID=3156914 RepID=UPI0033D33E3B